MADAPGRKADLDKEGIIFQDAGKAELDKDGISLDAQEAPAPTPHSEPSPDKEQARKPSSNKRLILTAGLTAAGLLVILSVLGYFFLHEETKQPQVAQRVVAKKESPFGQDGIVLDPFMVFYPTAAPKKSGVLVAQVSLKIDPSMANTIQSKLFDIRNIIYKRLTAAASVYSQTEITLMLSDDLMDYPIQEVAFVQYSTK